MKTKLLPLLLIGLSVAGANAAITLLDSGGFATNADLVTDAQLGGLTFGSNPSTNKLVVTIGSKGFTFAAGPGVVSYNGMAMNLITSIGGSNAANGWVGVYYLDGVTTAGSVTIGNTGSYSLGVAAYVLDGVEAGGDGIGATAATNAKTATLTGASSGNFVVAAFTTGVNGQSASTNSPLTSILATLSVGSASHASGYDLLDVDGDYSVAFTSGASSGLNTVAVEFVAIPEPTAALLGSLGLLTLLRRRR